MGIEIVRSQTSHNDLQFRFVSENRAMIASLRQAYEVSIIEATKYHVEEGEQIFAMAADDIGKVPSRLGVTKWIPAGKNRIWVIANPASIDPAKAAALVRLGIRGWDENGNTIHSAQRRQMQSNAIAAITNVPLNISKNELLDALEIDKKARTEFFVVANGDAFSYNIETRVEPSAEWSSILSKIDSGIIVRSLVNQDEDEWDW